MGRSHECDYPPEVVSLPVCTSSKLTLDGTSYDIEQRVKAILQEGLSIYRVDAAQLDALRPDVIITQEQSSARYARPTWKTWRAPSARWSPRDPASFR